MTPLTETLIALGASGLGLELAVKATLIMLAGGLAALCLTRAPAAASPGTTGGPAPAIPPPGKHGSLCGSVRRSSARRSGPQPSD